MLIRSQAPVNTRRYTASPRAQPSISGVAPDVIQRFVEQHREAVSRVQALDERDAARTIMTSVTVLLSSLSLMVFGRGTVLFELGLIMFFGVITGTYSSIYVAAPITEWADRRFFGASADQKKAITKTRAVKKKGAVV